MTEELVHLEVSRGVGTITLDSPHNRNALPVSSSPTSIGT